MERMASHLCFGPGFLHELLLLSLPTQYPCVWQYLPTMKRPKFAFIQRPFSFPFLGWAVVTERARPPRYLLSVVRALISSTSIALVALIKATAAEGWWSTDFFLVASWAKLSRYHLSFLYSMGSPSEGGGVVNRTLECRGAEGNVSMAAFALPNWLNLSESWCARCFRS